MSAAMPGLALPVKTMKSGVGAACISIPAIECRLRLMMTCRQVINL
jgi:hypothetical protein